MVGDRRQGWALLAAMLVLFVPLTFGAYVAEQSGNPVLDSAGLDTKAGDLHPGGNMEGKEVRFGVASSALWASATTAASNGSVNSMHDSFTPLGGLVPMWLMQLGEVVFGGVGSGLYGLIVFAIVAVFVAGLMVGRTPEYLGKKIEAFEMKMASLAILAPCFAVLVGTAVAVAAEDGRAHDLQPRPARVQRSALRVLVGREQQRQRLRRARRQHALLQRRARHRDADRPLRRRGARHRDRRLARGQEDRCPRARGRCRRMALLFIVLLVAVVVIVGALTFIPGLALGPIVEHLRMPR